MSNFFARQNVTFKNDLNRSLGALVGIAQGLICDAQLNDSEITFLNSWLSENENISLSWPGDVVHARVKDVLADGVVTDDERKYLLESLQKLIGGKLLIISNSMKNKFITALGNCLLVIDKYIIYAATRGHYAARYCDEFEYAHEECIEGYGGARS